jgi:hypothetical protein
MCFYGVADVCETRGAFYHEDDECEGDENDEGRRGTDLTVFCTHESRDYYDDYLNPVLKRCLLIV